MYTVCVCIYVCVCVDICMTITLFINSYIRRTLALLASFVVQSELGDYDPSVHKARYLKEFKFIPNQPAVSYKCFVRIICN